MFSIELLFIAFLTGIYIANHLPGVFQISCGLLALSTILLIANACRGYINRALILLYVFMFAVGAVRAQQANYLPLSDSMHYAGYAGHISGKITAEPVVLPLDESTDMVRYFVALDGITIDGVKRKISGGASVAVKTPRGRPLPIPYDKVSFAGKITLPKNFNNPGMFDYVGMLRREGISVRITEIPPDSVQVIQRDSPYYRVLYRAWNSRIQTFMQKVLPSEDAALLNGMVFGGYTGIDREVARAFSKTGIIHILSVSGAHVALVCGTILWLGRALKLRRGMIISIAALCTIIYGLVCGMTAPVVRSIIMGLIALAGTALGRDNDARRALVFSGFVMLLVEPRLSDDISFQLSFASTAGLVYFSNQCTALFAYVLPKGIARAFSVTMAAQLGILPFAARYFSSISLSAFFANLIIVPFVEAIVIVGLAAVLLITFWLEWPGRLLLVIVGLLIKLVIFSTQLLAGIPAAELYIPPFNLLFGCIYYGMLYFICNDLGKDAVAKFGTACCIVFVIGFLLIRVAIPNYLEVHFIDVGQGDAALFITPNRKSILIDSGGGLGQNFDVGERIIAPYLNYYGVRELDYLIITHSHDDHAGGSAGVASHKKIKNIILPKGDRGYPVKKLLKTVGTAARVTDAVRGERFTIDGVSFEFVHAGNAVLNTQGNEYSLVIRAEYHNFSCLVTGDLGFEGEDEIMNMPLKQANVLKVGHHGSKNATSEEFLAAISPQAAVISAGYGNRFGHPHPDTLERLTRRKIQIFRTDLNGAIIFYTNGEQIKAKTYIK